MVGVLSFTTTVIQEGRLFFFHILGFLKECYKSGDVEVTDGVHKDIAWWISFRPRMNGKTNFPTDIWLHPDSLFHTDACLTGMGGYMNGFFFHHEIP